MAEIDRMDGRSFEQYLGTLFARLGYRAEVTPYVGDFGADLVVAKDGARQVVQAKRSNRPVGVKAVQEVVAARQYYHCSGALVVTNRAFTASARRLAGANGVKLWDRHDLVDKSLTLRRQELAKHAEPLPNGMTLAQAAVEGVRPSGLLTGKLVARQRQVTTGPVLDKARCARCGVAVSDRVRAYCLGRPGRFGGRIYCFKHQRTVRPGLPPG
jgi:restriction system protein